jgi:hypothetical protein
MQMWLVLQGTRDHLPDSEVLPVPAVTAVRRRSRCGSRLIYRLMDLHEAEKVPESFVEVDQVCIILIS